MTPSIFSRAAVIGAAAFLISTAPASRPAQAAPFSPSGIALQQGEDLVETVQARRRVARRVVRRRGNRAAAGAALAIGVLGAAAAIAATQNRGPRYAEPQYYYDPGYQPGYTYGAQPGYYYQQQPTYYYQQQPAYRQGPSRWEQRRAYEAQVRAQQDAQRRAQWEAQRNAQYQWQNRRAQEYNARAYDQQMRQRNYIDQVAPPRPGSARHDAAVQRSQRQQQEDNAIRP